jgi:hypothetical protein
MPCSGWVGKLVVDVDGVPTQREKKPPPLAADVGVTGAVAGMVEALVAEVAEWAEMSDRSEGLCLRDAGSDGETEIGVLDPGGW